VIWLVAGGVFAGAGAIASAMLGGFGMPVGAGLIGYEIRDSWSVLVAMGFRAEPAGWARSTRPTESVARVGMGWFGSLIGAGPMSRLGLVLWVGWVNGFGLVTWARPAGEFGSLAGFDLAGRFGSLP
jgi:hypothetical protein